MTPLMRHTHSSLFSLPEAPTTTPAYAFLSMIFGGMMAVVSSVGAEVSSAQQSDETEVAAKGVWSVQ